MDEFRRGMKVIRDDGMTATFMRRTAIPGFIVVSYDDDTALERVATASAFRPAANTEEASNG